MEITLGNPQYLWLLLLIPFMIFAHFFWLRHTKRKAMKFANFLVLKRLTGGKTITKNYSLLVFRMLILIVAVLAATQVIIYVEGPSNADAFVIALDTSASMEARDIAPSRIEAAKSFAELFVDKAAGRTDFAIVTFSGITLVEQTLTDDRDLIHKTIQEVFSVQAGGTDIPGAIISSTNLLVGTEKGKAILLITDGSNTLETFAADSILQAVEYAKDHAVAINTIGVGSRSAPIGYLPSYYNISGVYNEEALESIANQTGGVYFHASDIGSLDPIYSQIAGSTEITKLPNDLTPYLLIILLVLILLEWGLANTRFRSIP